MILYSNFEKIVSGTIIGDCNDTNILTNIDFKSFTEKTEEWLNKHV